MPTQRRALAFRQSATFADAYVRRMRYLIPVTRLSGMKGDAPRSRQATEKSFETTRFGGVRWAGVGGADHRCPRAEEGLRGHQGRRRHRLRRPRGRDLLAAPPERPGPDDDGRD